MKTARYAVCALIFLAFISCSASAQSSGGSAQSGVSGTPEVSSPAGKPQVTEKPLVTFVELGSVNCIPCRQMQPVMKELERLFPEKVAVVFYDVWTDAGAPYGRQYGIRAIPTQVFLDKDGKEFFRHVGFFPLEDILKVLETKGVRK